MEKFLFQNAAIGNSLFRKKCWIEVDGFDENMKKVMFDENDKEHSATPIWWDGSKIRFDPLPKSLQNKK